jgi:nicotinate dehydrogenase subunit B
MVSKLRGGLDADGKVIAWDYRVWTPGHASRPNGQPAGLLAGQLLDPSADPVPRWRGGGDRNATHLYSFPNSRVTVNWLAATPLRTSSLRSLGGMANTTATEAFLDELAALAGADPVAFRLRHLDDPRAIAVIKTAAELTGWQPRLSPAPAADRGAATPLTGRGIAYAQYESAYAYVAIVAEVAVVPTTGAVRVLRVCVAHDCGQIINPDGVANQIEGNVIHGISRTLKEEVIFDRQHVTSLDFTTYPIATFPESPELRIALIDRPDEPPYGAGEPAICPVAAAIGNAIFDATGIRLRTVPFTATRLLAAMRAG